ncbi:GAF domain-containing sensor histidine kinase [Metabacillus arenae]|uniref:histidine kinase n=1 Tax=Metabacillus arenae TaxID=2771434 RepID=A0A926RXU5_9BACI|nr:GAF domain-containing sensor histidine kinase [Metabacillus arenae]MBD1382263.1 GAF domain-containing sensor histidine kinase [Metabacillus arenae]
MEENEKRIHKLLTLKTIAETLNQGSDLSTMLNKVLEKLLNVTGLKSGWIFLIDNKGVYKLAADYSLPQGLCFQDKMPMCQGGCWCLDRYQDGRLEKATNIINCRRIEKAIKHNWGDTQNITHHATVPLRAGNEKFGLLNVASPHKTHFSDEELTLLEAVAFQIGSAIKRITLAENEQRLALIAERNRLAQDLHDSVSQLLFSLMLTARGTKEITTDEKVKEMLVYMQELSHEALTEMKALIWQLRPQGIEEGIAAALLNYGKVLSLEIDSQVKGIKALPLDVEETLWRIGQEALNNIKKHANTKKAFISLDRSEGKVQLIISDSGSGFQYHEKNKIPSFGLRGMKERAEKHKGTFYVKTKNGKGTTIQVTIPI